MRTMPAICVIAALVVFAPQMALANGPGWTQNGKFIEADQHVLLEGSMNFSSATLGSVSCSQATATVELTATTLKGHVASLTADEPSSCPTTGLIKSLCGEKSLTAMHLATGNVPAVQATLGSKALDVTGIDLVYEFAACEGLVIHMTGSLTADLDSETAINTATLTGELSTSPNFGKVKVSGTLSATPAGTIGFG